MAPPLFLASQRNLVDLRSAIWGEIGWSLRYPLPESNSVPLAVLAMSGKWAHMLSCKSIKVGREGLDTESETALDRSQTDALALIDRTIGSLAA